MQPKTKLQIYIDSIKVPAITQKQMDFNESLFPGEFTISRNRLFCLECNHKWDEGLRQEWQLKVLGKTRECPNCKKHLKFVEFDNHRYKDEITTVILDVIKGMQVVRYINTQKYSDIKHKPAYYHTEIVREWITDTGKLTVYNKIRNGMMGSYGGGWSYGSQLELRSSKDFWTINYHSIQPGRKILPIFRRNGYSRASIHFFNLGPTRFFINLLRNPIAETLLKAGQHALFKDATYRPSLEKIQDHWGTIKILMRNNYIITDASLFWDYMTDLIRDNKDTLNAHYVCPKDMMEAHMRYVRKRLNQERSERMSALRVTKQKMILKMKKDQKKYEEEKSMFFNLIFKEKNIKIEVFKSVQQLLHDSEYFGHCAFTSGYHNKASALMMRATVNDVPVETIEVDLNKMEIVQARGHGNQFSTWHSAIINLVNKNLHRIESIHFKSIKQKNAKAA